MNLSQILQTALPDLPPQRLSDAPPHIHPNLIAREHLEREGVFVRCIIPNRKCFYRLTKLQYSVATLFNGQRSYQEIAALCESQLGLDVSVEQLKEFAELLEGDEFWHRTAQEESVILAHELAEQRHKVIRRKRRNFDPTTIELFYFDPEKMLDWLHRHVKWMYSGWFFAWSLFMIGVAVVILGSHGSTLWNDTLYFYNLTAQPLVHVFEFFGIFLVLGAIHECAHGVTCHHYGGKSHRMGVFLMYTVPGVFCDCAEAFVLAGRWGRIVTVAAGVWSEILVCSYLSVVWWLTTPGTTVHNLAYIFILSGGIFAVLINWNPLSRMDGYFIFCEIFNFYDLKGNSTSYLVNLVRKYIFRMPATVPPMAPLRRVGFVTYATLSGLYCYLLLATFCRITYHILLFYWPLWAFVPATGLGLIIFRTRIRKLGTFLRELYLDKRSVMHKHGVVFAAAGISGLVLLLLLLPLRHEYVGEQFVLEPVQEAVVRASVSGHIAEVLADEGSLLAAGATLARLRDIDLESRAAQAGAEYQVAEARAFETRLRYAGFAAAEQQRLQTATDYRMAREQVQNLQITTPVAGVVLTPRMGDLRDRYVTAGTTIAEVADVSTLRARIFVPEPEVRKLQYITGNSVHVAGLVGIRHGEVAFISPSSRTLAAGLEAPAKYGGVRDPAFFTVDVLLANPKGDLRPGMTGTAKIYGRRRSLLATMLQPFVDAVARRLW